MWHLDDGLDGRLRGSRVDDDCVALREGDGARRGINAGGSTAAAANCAQLGVGGNRLEADGRLAELLAALEQYCMASIHSDVLHSVDFR